MSRLPDTPVKVTIVKGPGNDNVTRKTHPSFGMASFSRCNGGDPKLFGSEIKHTAMIRFRLGPGESNWHLHETRYHGPLNPTYVEFDMSMAQFAEMITSMNVGMGVPCTIRTLNSEQIPGFTDSDNLHEQIKDDLVAKTDTVVATAKALEKELASLLDESKLPKAKQVALRRMAAKIVMELGENMPFVLDQYQEAAEKVKAKAAAEVDALMTGAIQRLGMERLQQLTGKGPNVPTLDR